MINCPTQNYDTMIMKEDSLAVKLIKRIRWFRPTLETHQLVISVLDYHKKSIEAAVNDFGEVVKSIDKLAVE